MNFKTIFSVVVLLAVFSCKNTKTEPIALNNGEKWDINVEMMPPLNASKKLFTEFSTNENKDYKALALQLKKNNKSLISSCTMVGKSHDELHKWLQPYMGLLDELEDAENDKEANKIVVKIEKAFKTFDENFQ